MLGCHLGDVAAVVILVIPLVNANHHGNNHEPWFLHVHLFGLRVLESTPWFQTLVLPCPAEDQGAVWEVCGCVVSAWVVLVGCRSGVGGGTLGSS
jgi:hypothetical protein